jgi:hypothetical protein
MISLREVQSRNMNTTTRLIPTEIITVKETSPYWVLKMVPAGTMTHFCTPEIMGMATFHE